MYVSCPSVRRIMQLVPVSATQRVFFDEELRAFSEVQALVVVQTQSMEALLSQLAETAAQERALLEECGDLLSVAASLEVNIDRHRFF
jgi:hypothetical protein